jgi:hypothetical protein
LKKLLFILTVLFCISAAVLPAQDGLNLSIRFNDKKIYDTESDVYIKVSIQNNTAKPISFKLADKKIFNMDFSVRSTDNISLGSSEYFMIERSSNKTVFFKDLSINPGEEISFIENLKNYINIEKSGVYVIDAVFFPELFTGLNDKKIKSNTLSLAVRPPMGLPDYKLTTDEMTKEQLRKEALPPDKVVEYTITARQRSQWTKFFLYIDLDELILRTPEKKRIFQLASHEDRIKMISDYKKDLMQEKADKEILLVPSSFEIINTSYTPTDGRVKVIQRFSYTGYTEKKEYVYTLKNKDGIWMIVNYWVTNLGTE